MSNSNKKTLSIIGCGMVGNAVYHGMSPSFDIKIYDKYKSGYSTLEDTVKHSEFIFVCLPTPMDNNGKQDISILTNTIKEIVNTAQTRKILIIKSTIIPGTTRNFKNNYNEFGFVFNPEFLTARTNILDFINQYRIILGSDNIEDLDKVENLYRIRFPHTKIFKTGFEESEFVKYMNNCFYAVKISIMNEFYDMCKFLNISYEEVRKLFLADLRVANSHTEVPGPDFLRGFGGLCFPKDINALTQWCKSNNLDCDMFEAAWKVNERVREDKDWYRIKGATTENNFE